LSHRRLNSTQIYARVHDRTVADDYFNAMAQVESRVNLGGVADASCASNATAAARQQLLKLAGEMQMRRMIQRELTAPATT
jgi:hypothetical protein